MTAHPWLGTGSAYGNAVSCTWERGGYVAYLANPKRYCNASEILRMPIPGYTDAELTSQPVVSGGEPVGLVVFGPGATIQRTRSAIERFVDWDLSIDDALVALRRVG